MRGHAGTGGRLRGLQRIARGLRHPGPLRIRLSDDDRAREHAVVTVVGAARFHVHDVVVGHRPAPSTLEGEPGLRSGHELGGVPEVLAAGPVQRLVGGGRYLGLQHSRAYRVDRRFKRGGAVASRLPEVFDFTGGLAPAHRFHHPRTVGEIIHAEAGEELPVARRREKPRVVLVGDASAEQPIVAEQLVGRLVRVLGVEVADHVLEATVDARLVPSHPAHEQDRRVVERHHEKLEGKVAETVVAGEIDDVLRHRGEHHFYACHLHVPAHRGEARSVLLVGEGEGLASRRRVGVHVPSLLRIRPGSSQKHKPVKSGWKLLVRFRCGFLNTSSGVPCSWIAVSQGKCASG